MADRLTYLGTTYFHEDYDLEADTPAGVVALFRDAEDPRIVQAAVDALGERLAACDEDELCEFWLETCESYYDPARDGMTYRQWFERMRDILTEPRSPQPETS